MVPSRLLTVCYAVFALAVVILVADSLLRIAPPGAGSPNPLRHINWLYERSLSFSADPNCDSSAALRRTTPPLASAASEGDEPSALAATLTDLDGSVSLAFKEPLGLVDNMPLIAEGDFNELLTGSSTQGGPIKKTGVVAESKWRFDGAEALLREAVKEWSFNQTLGLADGSAGVLPLGVSPPKAGLCTVLFNPVYKFAFVKNTKVAGTSVFLNFGGLCDDDMDFDKAKESEPCFWSSNLMAKAGPKTFGYNSFDELWQAYTVFALVRNPYDRAGSSYEYILSRRKNHDGQCRDPPFSQFLARPYILGLQDMLFNCNEPIHDFYHVEPQYECLVNDEDELAVDFVVRLESLQSDMDGLIDVLNTKKAADLDRLSNEVGWAQKGPRAKADSGQDAEDSDADSSDEVQISRHLSKFSDCGVSCFHHARTYYAKDFELLKYPQLPSSQR